MNKLAFTLGFQQAIEQAELEKTGVISLDEILQHIAEYLKEHPEIKYALIAGGALGGLGSLAASAMNTNPWGGFLLGAAAGGLGGYGYGKNWFGSANPQQQPATPPPTSSPPSQETAKIDYAEIERQKEEQMKNRENVRIFPSS